MIGCSLKFYHVIFTFTFLAILLPNHRFFVALNQHENEFIPVSSLKLCFVYIIMHVKMSYNRKLGHHITTQQTSSSLEDSKEQQLNISSESENSWKLRSNIKITLLKMLSPLLNLFHFLRLKCEMYIPLVS